MFKNGQSKISAPAPKRARLGECDYLPQYDERILTNSSGKPQMISSGFLGNRNRNEAWQHIETQIDPNVKVHPSSPMQRNHDIIQVDDSVNDDVCVANVLTGMGD